MNKFTAKQREVIARKMGYEGPMQGFDTFLQSSPSLSTKYNMITDKYTQRMAKGGLVKKYQAGGSVTQRASQAPSKTNQGTERTMGTEFTDVGGVPMVGGAAQMTAAQITERPDQIVSTMGAPSTATTATATTAPTAAMAAAPTAIKAATTTTASGAATTASGAATAGRHGWFAVRAVPGKSAAAHPGRAVAC
jgi:hypothetical protein